ncbi:MAG: glycoside hydrolase family 15 protein [Proteobacteria bacterium]|nr:glycoside hydrolase family 15 protein [Pseudomonadota bacterium]
MSVPIEDYAMIGDGNTAALVSRSGSVDWLCWPHFDSDACCAALLGGPEHGHWQIAPATEPRAVIRRYKTDTLVLETEFETDTGVVRLIDFMPVQHAHSTVVRIVVGVRGQVAMHGDLALRFDFGAMPPWVAVQGTCMQAELGPHQVVLRGPAPLTHQHDRVDCTFTVAAAERVAFTLSYGTVVQGAVPPIDAEAALAATVDYWHRWIGRFDKSTAWPEAVRRSLITLKALIFHPSGGVLAAPTTSLPEIPGGHANWDYRYCWVRDASFTLTALLNAGYHEEAAAWRNWILRAVAGRPEEMRIMYRIDGARHIGEREIPWLPGYDWSRPVLVGNKASLQHQADVYGELIEALYLGVRGGIDRSARSEEVQAIVVAHIEKTWMAPGAGLWEQRGEQRHYVYARVMAWVGIDCFLRGGAEVDAPTRTRLEGVRDRIHQEVCANGYHAGLGRFVEYFGGQSIDASLLLLPLVGFLPVDDPRIVATIDAVERELMEGGFVRRKKADSLHPEGAFLACTLWLADCRAMQGNHDAAREIVERVLAIRNDVGLLSEEYNVPGRRLAGNFPQALTHLALVNTILGLSGPVLQRGGG